MAGYEEERVKPINGNDLKILQGVHKLMMKTDDTALKAQHWNLKIVLGKVEHKLMVTDISGAGKTEYPDDMIYGAVTESLTDEVQEKLDIALADLKSGEMDMDGFYTFFAKTLENSVRGIKRRLRDGMKPELSFAEKLRGINPVSVMECKVAEQLATVKPKIVVDKTLLKGELER